MRALSIAAVIVLSSLAGLTYAQGAAQGKETEITQPTPIVLKRPLDSELTTCFLPDNTGYPLDTTTTFDGQRYRCVEVFAPTELVTQAFRFEPVQPDAGGKPVQSDAGGKLSVSRSPGTLAVRMAGWIRVP